MAFLAYYVQVTPKAKLRALAPGLTPREALSKFKTIQMVDVHLPTTEPEQKMLLHGMQLPLPAQPPPRVTAPQVRKHRHTAPVL